MSRNVFFSPAKAVALAAATFGLLAGSAKAGTYDVIACNGGFAGGASSAFVASANAGMAAYPACPYTPNNGTTGLVTRTSVPAGVGWVPYFAGAYQVFEAPPGAALSSATFDTAIFRTADYWSVAIVGWDTDFQSTDVRWGCYAGRSGCGIGTFAFFGPITVDLNGRNKFRVETRCGSPAGCDITSSGVPPYMRALFSVANVTVRVQDYSAPNISPQHGALWGDGWHRGYEEAWSNYTDNVGIMITRLYVDGNIRETQDYRDAFWPAGIRCDYTQRRPCKDITPGGLSVNTAGLPDGPHAMRVEAVDTAGNVAGIDRTIRVDNHAPGRVSNVAVVGGEDWQASNDFTVQWTTPAGQTAPIARAHYRLCTTDANPSCSTGSQLANGIEQLSNLTVPEPGDYTLRVWLEDEAGNVSSENASDLVHLRFDNVPPGEAKPAETRRWLNAREATAYDQFIDMRQGAFRPVSGIKGFSVTTDGSDPDGTLDVVGNTYRINNLPEGVNTVKARAISGALVASNEVGSTEVRVDKSPPSASVEGAPDPHQWQRGPVNLSITGTDQVNLSGMAAAPPQSALEEGAYMAHRVDGGGLQQTRGDRASVSVSGDGRHTLTYHAVDLAGNESAERTLDFKVDATPPEVAAFEPLDPKDPRKVSAVVFDRTSGVAGGTIEMRRSVRGEWGALATSLQEGHLSAHIDDVNLPDGTYEFRVRVRDRAGNERVSDRRQDGSKMEVKFPLRRASRLTVATRPLKACRKGARRSASPCGRRGIVKRGAGRPVLERIKIRRSRKAAFRGLLDTSEGAPIGRGVIDVLHELRTGGGFRQLATLRTDTLGRFNYRLGTGPSRTIRFSYEGTNLIKPTTSDVMVLAPARTTIAISNRFVHNGQGVWFRGRLVGKPFPDGGKLIDLQAYYRGQWRTFATPRTDSRGRWKFHYRFEATRGLVTYRFRARVRREATYPYELGYSSVVRVTVSGG